jgi:hypothetical protein
MRWPIRLLAMACVALPAAACSTLVADEKADDPSLQGVRIKLAGYPGAESQIRSYYDQHGQEGDDTCGLVQMGRILRVSELSSTQGELKFAFHYTFTSLDQRGRSDYCNDGFNTRIAVFKKSPGGLELVRMTGELASA